MPLFRRNRPADHPGHVHLAVAADEKPPTPSNPRSGSGRGHYDGYLEHEEFNAELRHPQGHRVFDKMYRTDADTRQVVQLSINPILAGTWDVDPYGGQEADETAVEQAAVVKWALFEHMRPNLIGHLAQFLPVLFRSGFVPGEQVWETAEHRGKTYLVPKTIGMMLPRSIWRWEQKNGELLAVEQFLTSWDGRATSDAEQHAPGGGNPARVRVARRDLVYYRVGAEGDNWEGVSLLRPAYKHWFLKDKIERIDAIAQENEAMGIPVVYPPPGATPAQLDKIEEILRDMRTNEQGYIVMPGMKAGAGAPEGSGWLFEIMSFGGGDSSSGSGRDAMPTLNYHTNKIAAAFISEFMRLGHGESGARATAQVQADPFQMSIEALVTLVEQEIQDSIVIPFCRFNFPGIEDFPKLRMSLVDQTSLSQLADFVLKLTQVGALLPDQELEEFLRARADMPPPNPKSVKERGENEEMIRRAIVGGNIERTPAEEEAAAEAQAQADKIAAAGGDPSTAPQPKGPKNNDDPFGSNAKVGKHKNGKPAGKPHGASAKKTGSPSGPGAGGARTPRGPGKELSHGIADDVDLPPSLHDEARWWELMVDLDALEADMDGMPKTMLDAVGEFVYDMANELVDPTTNIGYPVSPQLRADMESSLRTVLEDAYVRGRDHALSEMSAQGFVPGEKMLDRGARDRGGALVERARVAAERVEVSMREAMLGQDLAHGGLGAAKQRAEQAGLATLKRIGIDHGVAGILHGRHDLSRELEADGVPIKVRYSAVLDRGTCPECADADDGQARAIDDPVRLERQPPNPQCHSLASGFNRCRCIEVYEFEDDGVELSEAPAVDAMPDYLRRIVGVLAARGMPEMRAFVVAARIAKHAAETGDVRWPGLRRVGAGNREAAREAVDWLEQMDL